MKAAFDYIRAFQRTLGWVTARELERIRNSTVAIAGLGGVGGAHLVLGVARKRLAAAAAPRPGTV